MDLWFSGRKAGVRFANNGTHGNVLYMRTKGAGEAKGESIFLTGETRCLVTSLTTKYRRQSNLRENGKEIK